MTVTAHFCGVLALQSVESPNQDASETPGGPVEGSSGGPIAADGRFIPGSEGRLRDNLEENADS